MNVRLSRPAPLTDAAAGAALNDQTARASWAEWLLARITTTAPWLQALIGLAIVAFYAERIWTVYRDSGLFRRIGFDWGLFYSQASALAAGDIAAMYQVFTIAFARPPPAVSSGQTYG